MISGSVDQSLDRDSIVSREKKDDARQEHLKRSGGGAASGSPIGRHDVRGIDRETPEVSSVILEELF